MSRNTEKLAVATGKRQRSGRPSFTDVFEGSVAECDAGHTVATVRAEARTEGRVDPDEALKTAIKAAVDTDDLERAMRLIEVLAAGRCEGGR